ATEWVRIGIAVLLGALATAVIEETLFRGGLQSTLSKGGHVWLAAMIGSAVFAAAHFLDAEAYAGPIEWWSGLDVLWRSLQGFRDAPWHDSFIALLLAGLLLCFLRLRSGDIAAAIGVHMGWVVVIRLCKSLTELDRASPWVVWVGAYDGVVGYAGALLFLSLLAIGWVVYKPSPQLSGS
ncbi:MAG: CPBP family intramembrane glutamic endopeptidase, partial [Pseudomonadota bacterium]